jgi:hypothetical protein
MRLRRRTILVCATLVATGAAALALRTSSLQAQQPQQQTITIRGHVVDAASGAPVAAAAVTLTTRDPASRASETALAETTADGRFSFVRPARAATGAISVQAVGYLPGYLGQLGAQDIAVAGLTVDVLSVNGRDLEVRLTREGVISGTVRDRSGQPVAAADVIAFARRYTGAGWRWMASRPRRERTDDRGAYRIDQLPPGEYVVAIRPRTPGAQMTYAPSSPGVTGANVVRLRAGADAIADVDLDRDLPGGRLAGRLTGPPEAIAGLTLRLVRADDSADVDPYPSTADSGPDGRFEFAHVAPGAYRLRGWRFPSQTNAFTASGDFLRTITFYGPRAGVELTPPPADPTWLVDEPVLVESGRLTTIDAVVRPAGRVSGRVRFDGASLPASDRLPTIPIDVRPADGRDLGQLPQTRVEKDGTFRTAGLPPGDYVIFVRPSAVGITGWTMTSMRVGGRETVGSSVSIQGDVSDVLVTLVDRTTTIAGTVAGVQARADRTRVIVFPQNRAERSQYLIVSELRRVKQAFVGADGRFTTTVLPGDYYVAAVDGEIPDTWMTPESLERLVSDATAVSVALGDSRQIQVSPPRGGVR